MNFNWNVTHHGHGFLSLGDDMPIARAEGQLSLPEKEKWVVKTDLKKSKSRESFEVWCHLPKQVSWMVFTVIMLLEAFSWII